jgi:predicted PurR-regulated permease PerM
MRLTKHCSQSLLVLTFYRFVCGQFGGDWWARFSSLTQPCRSAYLSMSIRLLSLSRCMDFILMARMVFTSAWSSAAICFVLHPIANRNSTVFSCDLLSAALVTVVSICCVVLLGGADQFRYEFGDLVHVYRFGQKSLRSQMQRLRLICFTHVA